jgi:hypothetical protein
MLDDIQEDHFEYIDAFPPFHRLFPCIMVTPEMVQAGREKYATTRQQGETNDSSKND